MKTNVNLVLTPAVFAKLDHVHVSKHVEKLVEAYLLAEKHPSNPELRSVRTTCALDVRLVTRLKEIADKHELKLSNLIRSIIEEELSC